MDLAQIRLIMRVVAITACLLCCQCASKWKGKSERKITMSDPKAISDKAASPLPASDYLRFMLGPFTKVESNPVMGPRPRSESNFSCPWHESIVGWEEKDVFNPAAVVKDGKIHLLYRAEDNVGSTAGTSRIGLAISDDGLSFKNEDRRSHPVLYPAPIENDCCTRDRKFSNGGNLCESDCVKDHRSGMIKSPGTHALSMALYDGEGGCEDPRVVEDEQGTYWLTYTSY